MKKGALYSVLFMMVMTTIFTFLLAAVNQNTLAVIRNNQMIKNQKKILYAFAIPYRESMTAPQINELYHQHIKESKNENLTIYEGYMNDQLIGYAIAIEGPGLWGNIRGVVAINDAYDTILGINFLSHSETPGLGGRIDEDWFKEQFRNIKIRATPPYVIYRPSPDGTVDAISGATLTSKAVLAIINKELTVFFKAMEGRK
ncbi:FMN-binding protein [Thermotalea metallivorans]|uniref:Ion-translocating oxidoreductase complex subunit G n=1 Tax=Thermotalea metallivorans TaxID=520762 RepID=A0A140LB44_9FIRM|nr:FMN-binding protein [Thermotalea metallivorans]KXG77769.1 Electron transport complex subunit RnfG [Thermotalea metallivorans]